MLVLTSEEMKRAEQAAVAQGTTMSRLMQLAGTALAQLVLRYGAPAGKQVLILCGKGNNGGDGFICAGLLHRCGAKVTVALAQREVKTDLAAQAIAKLPPEMPILRRPEQICPALAQAEIIVDAIFGFGFRGEPQGDVALLIEAVNARSVPVFSADLPSGAECDTGRVEGVCVRATHTAAFSALKPAHISYPAKRFCGEVHVCPAGIAPELLRAQAKSCLLLDEAMMRSILPKRNPEGNKGTFGKLLCVCGSMGMAGAARMAVEGALRCGVGLVYVAVPRELYPILAPSLPQAVFLLLDEEADGSLTEESRARLRLTVGQMDACLVGCGLGRRTKDAVRIVLRCASCPVVLDADGLNIAAENLSLLENRSCPLVITPHPGEMARLTGLSVSAVQDARLETAALFAAKSRTITVLKGAATVIAEPNGMLAVNPTGNAGMGKGGSGDLLAGMLASFLAQGVAPVQAARLAVFVHGWAGDLCAEEKTQYAMQPTDLIDYFPQIFKKLLS